MLCQAYEGQARGLGNTAVLTSRPTSWAMRPRNQSSYMPEQCRVVLVLAEAACRVCECGGGGCVCGGGGVCARTREARCGRRARAAIVVGAGDATPPALTPPASVPTMLSAVCSSSQVSSSLCGARSRESTTRASAVAEPSVADGAGFGLHEEEVRVAGFQILAVIVVGIHDRTAIVVHVSRARLFSSNG